MDIFEYIREQLTLDEILFESKSETLKAAIRKYKEALRQTKKVHPTDIRKRRRLRRDAGITRQYGSKDPLASTLAGKVRKAAKK